MYKGPTANSGKITTLSKYHYYGLDYVKNGVSRWGNKVFRIENRIYDDGSNIPWLLVDGKEIGPLNFHKIYYSTSKEYEPIGTENRWINNKTFTIRYIYNYSSAFTSNPIYWLRIDTAGDVLATREVSATCKQAAGLENTCLLCGAIWVDTTEVPLAHTPQVLPGIAATCTQEGLTEGAVCSVCGEITLPQVSVPMTAHTEVPLKGHAPTCTQEGLTDGTACSVCQNVFTEQKPIPALGHAYEQGRCVRCGIADPDWWIPGDADGNKIVNYNDALLVLRCSIGLETISPFAALACDVDGNGSLSYNDALMILRRSIGLE